MKILAVSDEECMALWDYYTPGRLDGIDLGHQFITHGDMNSLYQHYGLDAQSIAKFVQEVRQS